MKRRKGLTLVELLVAISIASILTLGIGRLLETALASWRLTLDEVTISRLSEATMRGMMEGDDEFAGLVDAVELINVGTTSVTFVPLWMETFYELPRDGKFYLAKRLRPGAPPPTSEIKFRGSSDFIVYPTRLHWESGGNVQWIEFEFPMKPGSVVRLSYQPDARTHPELAMTYEWDKNAGKIYRRYNGKTSEFDLHAQSVKATSVQFSYFDGSHQLVDISGKKLSKENALIRISSVKIDLEFQGSEVTQQTSSLVNIRALGKAGQGVILAEGLEIPIPDSKHIRLLQLINFVGVDEGQVIELKIDQPQAKDSWRLKLYLGVENGISTLRRYEIFYPSTQLIYEQTEATSLEHGVDLLSIGGTGLYDYDNDEGVMDKVEFSGEQVTLSVLHADPDGVMLVVRP